MHEASPSRLTSKEVWALYFPLCLSWLFMALEGPISVKVIAIVGGHRAIEEVWTAAFNALMAIALFVESPVIDLLSTSTTLTKGAKSFATISRFALLMMGICFVTHFLVVLPPVYNLITREYSPAVREALWLPLVIMLPWSPAIGWRRYKQGILIRFGQTRLVGAGTFIRVTVMAGTGFGLAYGGHVSGILAAAWSLIAAVVAEAVFIHFAARRTIAERLRGGGEEELSLRRLTQFHAPLTVTTMMQLGSNFLITQFLALSFDRGTSWPSYQVALALMWLHRAVLYALPEVVITLYPRQDAEAVLWRFASRMAAGMSGLMITLAIFGLDKLFFMAALGKSEPIAESAHRVFLYSSLLPLIIGAQCYVRGILTALHETRPRMRAVFAGLTTMAGTMWLGLAAGWSGTVIASVGPTLGAVAELVVLVDAMRRARARASFATP